MYFKVQMIMKKRIFAVVAGLTLCAAALTGYAVYENQTSNPSDLMMKNLEALTDGEESGRTKCYNSISGSQDSDRPVFNRFFCLTCKETQCNHYETESSCK